MRGGFGEVLSGVKLTCLGVVILLGATAAWGGTIRDDVSDSLYTGLAAESVYDCVGMFDWTMSGGSYLASGVLINDEWVLTAAHVVNELDSTSLATMTFDLGGTIYSVSEAYYHSGYTGDAGSGNDIALVHLSTAVDGVTAATLYTDTAENHTLATVVGYGTTGTGLTGTTQSAGTKRAGTNVISLGSVLNTVPWSSGGTDDELVADFDEPGLTGDPLTSLGVATDLEYCATPGDSGGGWFVDVDGEMQLVGITSFIESSDSIYGNYGDLFASTRVSSYLDWIASYTDYNIPQIVLEADFNGDGVVDVLDLGILAGGWQLNGGHDDGDANGDGLVDVIDLGILAGEWQTTNGAGATTTPEPGSVAGMLAGMMMLRRRRARGAACLHPIA